METSFISWFRRFAVKSSVPAGIITFFSLIYCWITLPTFFLKEGHAVAEKIYKGTTRASGKHWSTELEVYFIKMQKEGEFYTFYMSEIDKFGIKNIVGRNVYYRYSTLKRMGNIEHLKVDNLIVFSSDKNNKEFLLSLIITILTGSLTVWGIVIDYENRSKSKQNTIKPPKRK